MTQLAVFLFSRFNAKQKIARPSSPSFLHGVTHGELRRGRGVPAVAGSKGTAASGKAKRKEDERERRWPGRALRGDTHTAGADRAAALPGMPTAAPARQVRAVQKTTRGGKKRENEKIDIFLKITNTHRHRKSPTINHQSKQKVQNNKYTAPTESKSHLPFVAWKVAMVLLSGGMGSPRRSPCRPLPVSPGMTQSACPPRRPPHTLPGLGLGRAAGPGPPAPAI